MRSLNRSRTAAARSALARETAGSDGIAGRVGILEFEPETRSGEVGDQRTIQRRAGAVEQHRFDAGMIVEIFDVADGWKRTAGMEMERRSGMSREGNHPGITEGRDFQKAGDAGTTRGIRLQYVHRACF